jgi:hypothetical protein
MDPNTKLLIDEIQKCVSIELQKRFDESDLKWEERFKEAECLHGDRIEKLEASTQSLEAGWPKVDAMVDSVKLEIGKLNWQWDRSVCDPSSSEPPIIPNPKSVSVHPSTADLFANGPKGHHEDPHNRDEEFGTSFTQFPIPIKGTFHFLLPGSLSNLTAHMSICMIPFTWVNCAN